MAEELSGPSSGGEKAPEAGGMPVQAVPSTKRFFLVEYAEEMRRGVRWLRSAPKPDVSVVHKTTLGFKKWTRLRKARVGVVAVLIIVGASYGLFAAQAASTPVVRALPGGGGGGGGAHNGSVTQQGTVHENGNTPVNVTVNSTRPATLSATLTWTDDENYGAGIRTKNLPDSMGLSVKAPDGENWTVPMAQNPQGGTGKVAWSLPTDGTKDYGGTAWSFVVNGGTMGDCQGVFFGCPAQSPDVQNSFTLKVDWSW